MILSWVFCNVAVMYKSERTLSASGTLKWFQMDDVCSRTGQSYVTFSIVYVYLYVVHPFLSFQGG